VVAAGPDLEPIQPMLIESGVTPGVAGQATTAAATVFLGVGVGVGAAMALVAMKPSSNEALAPAASAVERRALREY